MTEAAELLSELRGRGVTVAVDGESLCLKPKRALDQELLSRVRGAKPEILQILRDSTSSNPAAQPLRSENCWHCDGSGECSCINCGVMKPSVVWAAGLCVACKGKQPPAQ